MKTIDNRFRLKGILLFILLLIELVFFTFCIYNSKLLEPKIFDVLYHPGERRENTHREKVAILLWPHTKKSIYIPRTANSELKPH